MLGCGRGQGAERLDVRARTGRAEERRAERGRVGNEKLDRHPFHRDAHCPSGFTLHQREHRWQFGKALDHRGGPLCCDDDSELEALVGPAPRIAGNLAPERACDLREKCAGAVEEDGTPRSLLGSRESGEKLRLGLRADPGHRAEPSLGCGGAKLVDRPHSQRRRDGDHPPRTDAE